MPDDLADLERRARRCETHHVCDCGELRRMELEARVAALEEALKKIAAATSAEEDAGENYRRDDREGALDYAYAVARAALGDEP